MQPYQQSADVITKADAILIGAGAGMGVDSGLPDFRGNEGFWQAYPPMKKLGLSFYDLADPVWFLNDPQRAWGFYGHRRNLYRQTKPHEGFEILSRWSRNKRFGGFIFTSNVDGHFQKAGCDADRIVECHGAVDFNQCIKPCCHEIWAAGQEVIDVDMDTFRARDEMPGCASCGGCARPNILMFGDFSWIEDRTRRQYQNFEQWLNSIDAGKIAIIEIGAGTAVPTVRYQCERVSRYFKGDLIRINPRESHGQNVLSISTGALTALQHIDSILSTKI